MVIGPGGENDSFWLKMTQLHRIVRQISAENTDELLLFPFDTKRDVNSKTLSLIAYNDETVAFHNQLNHKHCNLISCPFDTPIADAAFSFMQRVNQFQTYFR